MSDSVQLLLDGTVLPGFDAIHVAPALAKLLKISDAQAQGMLAGKETTIKRQLPAAEISRYVTIFEQIGAAVRTQPVPPPMPPQPVLDIAPATTAQPEAQQPVATPAPAPAAPPTAAPAMALEAPVETITCPSCSFVQPRRTLCRECGADMPRMMKASQAAVVEQTEEPVAALRRSLPFEERRNHYDGVAPPFLSLAFNGRLNRLRYMTYSALVYAPMALVMIAATVAMGASKSMGLSVTIAVIGGIACACLSIRTMALRLHDLGLSGKWLWLFPACLLMLLTGSPIAGLVLMTLLGIGTLLLCIWPGNSDDNIYGNPNGPNTVWVYLGTIIFVGLMGFSGFSGQKSAMERMKGTQPDEEQVGVVNDDYRWSAADKERWAEQERQQQQEKLERQSAEAVIDQAAKEKGVEQSAWDREQAIQAYLDIKRKPERLQKLESEQRQSARAAIDQAAREKGVELSPEDRERAIQAYLAAMRKE